MSKKPRCIYQIDGHNGGIVSIAERQNENGVLLIVSNGQAEAQIYLSKEDFSELAGLQYRLRFAEPEPEQEPTTLRVVS